METTVELGSLPIDNVMQRFIGLGYRLNYRDGSRYIQLTKMFNNSDIKVVGGEQVQIGRHIELYNNSVISIPYMKRGWDWAGSAYAQKNKLNIYATGDKRLVAHF